MRENNLLDFNMYEQSLTQNGKQPNGAYSEQATPPPNLIIKDITENGEYSAADDNADGYSSVTVDVSGGGGLSGTDVKFYDYDGTVVYSYSAEEFLALTELPANPTHEGLTAQGWNWSLADAKEYVTTFGYLNIGQTYETSDGKTRIYITLSVASDVEISVHFNGELGEGSVDWGDGSDIQTFTGNSNITHSYAAEGSYVITVNTNKPIFMPGLTDKKYLITKVELGRNVDVIGEYDFTYAENLISITLHDGVDIDSADFTECFNLKALIIPNNITSVFSGTGGAYNCGALEAVSFPKTITNIGGSFQYCYALRIVTLPNITYIEPNMFEGCGLLSIVTVPNSVTEIGFDAFGYTHCLSKIIVDNDSETLPVIPDWGMGDHGYWEVIYLRDE